MIRCAVLLVYALPIFASSPLLEVNRGQFAADAQFVARSGAVSTAITKSGIEFRGHRERIALNFEGARLSQCEPDSAMESKAHYLALNPPIANVPRYSSVLCRAVYPGTDWVVRGSGDSLEHDWKLSAGAAVQPIVLSLGGSATAQLTANGDLLLRSGKLSIVWKTPQSYQDIAGTRHPVETQYILQDRHISLALGPHRPDLPLVIDPVIDFSYVVNGNGAALGCQVALDGAGNIYLAGLTLSSDFDTTPGAAFGLPAQLINSANQVFVRELSPDGSKELYSTYLGGGLSDSPHPLGLRVDSAGNVYVALDLWDSALAGGGAPIDPSGVVAVYKLAPGGGRLLYGTQVLPSFDYTAPVALAIDIAGNAYAAIGTTAISVSKIDPAGQTQLYTYTIPVSNYFGGLADLAVGTDGSVYIAGTTGMGGLVTTHGAWKSTIGNPQDNHGFLIRMKADGSGPIFSTYIGGDYLDSVSALAIDASGDAYVAGQTFGQGPDKALQGTSLGLTQPAAGPAFVMKIDPLGATALFTSLLPYSNVATLALDPTGNVYTAGQPNTANAIAVSKIDPTGQKLLYFSVIPATSPTLLGITVDPSGAAYLTGALADIQIPDSVPSTRLISNAFLLKIDPAPLQCDLSLEAQSNGSLLAGQAASLVLTIHNAGPAEAQNVVLTANTAQGVMLLSCRTSASGVCDPNLQVPSASFSSIPPGGSAAMELELPGGAQVAASVSTASSDLNQNNNSAIATPVSNFVPVSVQSDLATVITINGQPENLIFSVPPNSQVQIYCPSPQISRYGDVIVFESWSDGSTENPRTITATPPGISLTVNFSYLGTPYFTPASIVNAGSYAANGVSPGELISIYGFNLAQNATAELVNGRLPTSLGGTTLSFNGVAAPLIYAGSTQINAIVPYALGGQTTTKITLQNGNGTQSMTVPLIAAVPALFTANTSGNGQAAALNQDGTPNSPANPANPGDVIVLYGTGAGMVSPVPPDGSISSSAAAIPNLPITVTIGGQPATVLYAGSAPGLVAGVIQINARIPVGIQYSHHEAVTWSAGSFASPAGVTIAINDTPGPAYVYQAGPDDLSLSSIVLSPSRIAADSDATVVTISGSGFVSGMVAQWNNQPRATQFVDSATLQVTLTGNDLESAALGSLAVWDASQTHQITQAVPLLVYLPVLNNYLAYDSSRDKIYIAVAQKQMPQGASIAVLNPKTRRFERWYSLPIEPTKLALSADDRYLYVDQGNTVSRIDLTSWQADLEIQLGQDATLGSRQVYTMVTLPDTNTSLAVSFFKTGLSPPYLGTAVFDGAQIRPKVTESHNGPSYLIGGPDDTTLYGGDESGNFYTLNLDSSGATVANTVVGLLGSDGDSVYAGGLIYDSWGAAVDPSESLVVNTWDNQGLIVPLPNLQKVLILGGIPPPDFGQFSPLTVLTLHDLNIGQRLWSLPLPVSPELNHGPMLRWGTDGIVLRESQIYNASAPGIDIFRVNLGQ